MRPRRDACADDADRKRWVMSRLTTSGDPYLRIAMVLVGAKHPEASKPSKPSKANKASKKGAR